MQECASKPCLPVTSVVHKGKTSTGERGTLFSLVPCI